MGLKGKIAGAYSQIDSFFDRLMLGYKWRFDRFDNPRIHAYRGYGTRHEIRLKGRVLDDKHPRTSEADSVWRNVVNTLRRIASDDIPGARVRLRLDAAGVEEEVVTDDEGYFELRIPLSEPLPDGRLWHDVSLELLAPDPREPEDARVTGHVIVPPEDAEFGILSDLDDTVVRSGASDKLRFARTVLLNNAHTRVPFAGCGAFYRALEEGPDGRGHNPVFYVSSSPWNFYSLFTEFLDAHGIPRGPIFLKDFGFSQGKLLRAGHEEYKYERACRLLAAYPDLPFVLIGDSGQSDPEVYRRVVREHPGRIRAVYVRDVTAPERDREVHAIAEEVEAEGVPMVLAETTLDAAEHAAEIGLIRKEALEEVRAEREEERQQKGGGLLERLLG